MRSPNRLVWRAVVLVFLAAHLLPFQAQAGGGPAKAPKRAGWKFAVSGDSRNCGDVVMPAIAAGVKQKRPLFYWHLGDFRKITGVDEDIQHQPEHLAQPLTLPEYEDMAWKDFVQNQLAPFGKLPVYLAIGNHETAKPKTRAEFIVQFRPWFDAPGLRAQRLRDDPGDLEPKTYYHWIERGIDFITLDNATEDQFDAAQVAWFEKRLSADAANPRIRTIVAGMHEALPESISANHSMDQAEESGIEGGRRVYADLLKAQNEDHKRVYVLASHSHYFMDGIFNTQYWREHGGVLPGWIIGTAGAQRYALPPDAADARAAETNVYGYLLATVSRNGQIQFDFQRLNEQDAPAAVTRRYTPAFVHWCFAENSSAPH
ncbi:MAG: metallophosphoesterase [Candidatus Acidiferrales bacterium]